MERGRKAWVVGILACMLIAGASFLLRSASANKVAIPATSAQAETVPNFTLKVIGADKDLHFTSAADLPESASGLSELSPVGMARGDFRSNGSADMVGLYTDGGGSGQLRVRLANPLGGFVEMAPIGLATAFPRSIVVADFNGDGKDDIAVGGNGSISFLFGDGTGQFLAGPELAVEGNISSMIAGDFDRDGRQDLAAAVSGKLYIYLNTDTDLSKLTPNVVRVGAGSEIVGLASADFNGDHYADIAAATRNEVFVLRGAGNGAFEKARSIGSAVGITGMIAGDMTGHYHPDIAVSGQGGVTIWKTRLAKGFAAPRTFNAGGGLAGIERGFFNSDRFADLAVIRGNGDVAVLLNREGRDFSEPKEISVENGAVSLLSGFRNNGVDSIAVGRHGGLAVTTAAAGATIVVTTTSDEDDCPTCTSAQLATFTNGFGGREVPGGGTGISFREALTAANNDSLLPTPIVDDAIVFTGINSTASTNTHVQQVQSTCVLPVIDGGSGVPKAGTNTYWLINTSPGGTLPPIIAPGLTIDGSQVDTSANGVNNTLGPKVVLSSVNGTQQGAFLLVTSSATGATIKNLSLVGALGDAIQVAAENCTISGNNIGLDCAGTVQGNGNGSGVNTGSGVDFLSGSVNETVTNNFIGNNGTIGFPGGFAGTVSNEGVNTVPAQMTGSNGITVNGVSQSVSTPQNNVITGNTIGLDSHGRQAHNTGDGIMLQNGAVGNTIKNNTISSSATSQATFANDVNTLDGFGVDIEGDITADTIVQNNKIGTDPTGQTFKDANGLTIGNEHSGVAIGVLLGNPKFNTVSGNVISGNGFQVQIINFGVSNPAGPPPFSTDPDLGLPPTQTVTPQPAGDFNGVGITMASGDDNAQSNVISANLIGINSSGAVQIPNSTGGLVMTGLANNNTIGGGTPANGNQISGNNGPGVTLVGATVAGNPRDPNNNLLEDNNIGPNSLGAGGGPPLDQVTTSPQTSNKGGGILIYTGATEAVGNGPFANHFLTNVVAFNSSATTFVKAGEATSAGLQDDSQGNFNTFSRNQIFLNPPNVSPSIPAINVTAGQQGIRNSQIQVPTSATVIQSLINITSATTITTTGQTTITGTADFIDNGVIASINNSTVEVFVSQRGAATGATEVLSEAQVFIGPVPLISSQVDPNNPTHNTVDWSASLTVPAPFLNPVQTPTLFLTATITTGDGSTSPLSYGFVPVFVTGGGGGGGTGPTCSLSATPDPLNINGTAVGTTVTQNITLTNTSTAGTGGGTAQPVTVTAMTLNQTGSQFGFQIQSGSATPTGFTQFTLPPGGTETVIVSFTPTSTATASASLVITDTCGSLTVPINGAITQPNLSVIPTSLSFGSVNIGQSSVQQLTLINFGPGTLTVTALNFGKGAASPFSNNPPATLPLNVPADSLTSISVQFQPTQAGSQTDTLTIVSNDPRNPSLGVPLTGNGVSPLAAPPGVTVTAPTTGQIVSAGSAFTVSFIVTDLASPASPTYQINLSTNGGASFSPAAGGNASIGINNVSVTAPNVSTQTAVVQVVVSDLHTTGPGTGTSGTFTIGTPPVITSLIYSGTGKIKLQGTGIATVGATLVVVSTGEVFPLTFNGTLWIVKPSTVGSHGDTMKSVEPSGSQITVEVSSGGLTSAPDTVTRG